MQTADLLARASARGNPALARFLEQTFGRSSGRDLPSHAGDLAVTGPWSPPSDVFVVDGDLSVDGALITASAESDVGVLIVLGAVRCGSLLGASGSTVGLGGPVEVSGLLFAATCDLVFEVFGPLRAGILVSGAGTGWLTSHHDDVQVGSFHDTIRDGRTGGQHPAAATQPRVLPFEAFVPEAVDLSEWEGMSEDEQATERASGTTPWTYADFDEGVVHARFYAGLPLLREP